MIERGGHRRCRQQGDGIGRDVVHAYGDDVPVRVVYVVGQITGHGARGPDCLVQSVDRIAVGIGARIGVTDNIPRRVVLVRDRRADRCGGILPARTDQRIARFTGVVAARNGITPADEVDPVAVRVALRIIPERVDVAARILDPGLLPVGVVRISRDGRLVGSALGQGLSRARRQAHGGTLAPHNQAG